MFAITHCNCIYTGYYRCIQGMNQCMISTIHALVHRTFESVHGSFDKNLKLYCINTKHVVPIQKFVSNNFEPLHDNLAPIQKPVRFLVSKFFLYEQMHSFSMHRCMSMLLTQNCFVYHKWHFAKIKRERIYEIIVVYN
jgi:hypothetical protein